MKIIDGNNHGENFEGLELIAKHRGWNNTNRLWDETEFEVCSNHIIRIFNRLNSEFIGENLGKLDMYLFPSTKPLNNSRHIDGSFYYELGSLGTQYIFAFVIPPNPDIKLFESIVVHEFGHYIRNIRNSKSRFEGNILLEVIIQEGLSERLVFRNFGKKYLYGGSFEVTSYEIEAMVRGKDLNMCTFVADQLVEFPNYEQRKIYAFGYLIVKELEKDYKLFDFFQMDKDEIFNIWSKKWKR